MPGKAPKRIGGSGVNPDKKDHRSLALWATECAERVLPIFEAKCSADDRPWEAIEAGRAWAQGLIPCKTARLAALAAHAAARDALNPAAREAARAAGHAAATAHVAGHARHAAAYAVKAVRSHAHPNEADHVAEQERQWQIKRLPKHLRTCIFY
jgi:hypothetical protein